MALFRVAASWPCIGDFVYIRYSLQYFGQSARSAMKRVFSVMLSTQRKVMTELLVLEKISEEYSPDQIKERQTTFRIADMQTGG